MQVGDLIRLRGDKTIGIVLEKNKIAMSYDNPEAGKTLAVEYLVNLITNNKTAWYIEDSLELVNEGRRLGKAQSNGRVGNRQTAR